MKKIKKYMLEFQTYPVEFKLKLPKRFEIVDACGDEKNDLNGCVYICLWVAIDTSDEKFERVFDVIYNDNEIPYYEHGRQYVKRIEVDMHILLRNNK